MGDPEAVHLRACHRLLTQLPVVTGLCFFFFSGLADGTLIPRWEPQESRKKGSLAAQPQPADLLMDCVAA